MGINDITLAHPYAKGIFALAFEQNQLVEWKQLLEYWTKITMECHKNNVFVSPFISRELLLKIFKFSDVGQRLKGAENLLKLLIWKKQLQLIPQITRLFTELFNTQQKILAVNVSTPFKLTEEYKQKLIAILLKRFNKTIILSESIDEHLIGGMVIRINDLIIDVSVRGAFEKLRKEL
jgi:F-type H+-transporting ATPase subunit delta